MVLLQLPLMALGLLVAAAALGALFVGSAPVSPGAVLAILAGKRSIGEADQVVVRRAAARRCRSSGLARTVMFKRGATSPTVGRGGAPTANHERR